MKRMLINVILSFLLVGCYPCRFLDWNCNELDEGYSKRIDLCLISQREKGEIYLKDKYTDKIDSHIFSKCIQDTNYKFERDSKYLNYYH